MFISISMALNIPPVTLLIYAHNLAAHLKSNKNTIFGSKDHTADPIFLTYRT